MLGYAVLTCRWLLVAVFVLAAGGKVLRTGFREFVASAGRLLPTRWSGRRRQVAVAVLAAEVAAVGLLVWPVTAPVGFGVGLGLSVLLATGVGAALRRGERAPCRCFGTSTTPLGPVHLVRNGAVAAAALTGLVLAALTPPAPVHPAGAGLAILVGFVLAALVVRMDDLASLFAPMPTGGG
jgi:hypothetical protein